MQTQNHREEETLRLRGSVRAEIRNEAGDLIDTREVSNLIVTAGRSAIAAMIAGGGPMFSHLALGTGTTPAALADTTLQTEVFRTILTAASSASNVVTVATFIGQSQANGNTLTEAGLCTSATAGAGLCARAIFAAIVKTASISITFTWSITVS